MSGAVASRRRRPEQLDGVQKAAILCMALGAEASARILQQLGPEEVEMVSREIASTPSVRSEAVDSVLNEYHDVLRAVESIAQGGVDYARQILESALGPQRAKSVLEKIQEQMVETGLTKLKRAAPEVLNSVLRGEHPQTIALVLAHLDPKLAAGVVEAMGHDLSGDVLYRIARMEKVSPEVLQLVEAGLGARSDLTLSQEMTASGGPAAVAKVLNQLPGGTEKVLLDAINSRGHQVAEEIRSLMFVFEDLRLLDGRSMQRLLRDIEGKQLAMALKASSEELKEHILKNMSERAASALAEEMELIGPVKVKDVEAAHGNIVKIARGLQEQGEIVVERASDDEFIS